MATPSTSTTAEPTPAQKLATISADAAKEYAHKHYPKAAELYATAAELQATINGEENPLNADLLYLYGRALYHCGLEKSDVLGTGVSSNEAAREKKRAEGEGEDSKSKGKGKRKAEELTEGGNLKKGVFSFQGDENYDVDEEEDAEDADEEGEQEDDDDDFTLAWNVLDLARVHFNKRLENPPEDPEEVKKIKERLADVHDILGEVSLESESFKQACVDLEESLKIKQELYPIESTLITEAHYKLSLALEFASQGGGEGDADNEISPEEQKKGREQAVKHMRSAIASCKKRVETEEIAIKESSGDKVGDKPKDEAEKSVEEGKDLVKELEMRLRDLMAPPQPTNAKNNGLGEEQMVGILSSMMSGSSDDAKKMFADIISGANDITGNVRKKAKAPEAGPSAAASSSSNGAGAKRKAEDEEPVEEKKPVVAASNSKKPRVTTEEEEKAAEEGTPVA
ncbi:hypothetical protein AA313_de0201141 [Arthrobotrys entomopaga]|nr:hypothetical protein AA313_de0201141 [Arthrobotrys entomopaga]